MLQLFIQTNISQITTIIIFIRNQDQALWYNIIYTQNSLANIKYVFASETWTKLWRLQNDYKLLHYDINNNYDIIIVWYNYYLYRKGIYTESLRLFSRWRRKLFDAVQSIRRQQTISRYSGNISLWTIHSSIWDSGCILQSVT